MRIAYLRPPLSPVVIIECRGTSRHRTRLRYPILNGRDQPGEERGICYGHLANPWGFPLQSAHPQIGDNLSAIWTPGPLMCLCSPSPDLTVVRGGNHHPFPYEIAYVEPTIQGSPLAKLFSYPFPQSKGIG